MSALWWLAIETVRCHSMIYCSVHPPPHSVEMLPVVRYLLRSIPIHDCGKQSFTDCGLRNHYVGRSTVHFTCTNALYSDSKSFMVTSMICDMYFTTTTTTLISECRLVSYRRKPILQKLLDLRPNFLKTHLLRGTRRSTNCWISRVRIRSDLSILDRHKNGKRNRNSSHDNCVCLWLLGHLARRLGPSYCHRFGGSACEWSSGRWWRFSSETLEARRDW